MRTDIKDPSLDTILNDSDKEAIVTKCDHKPKHISLRSKHKKHSIQNILNMIQYDSMSIGRKPSPEENKKRSDTCKLITHSYPSRLDAKTGKFKSNKELGRISIYNKKGKFIKYIYIKDYPHLSNFYDDPSILTQDFIDDELDT